MNSKLFTSSMIVILMFLCQMSVQATTVNTFRYLSNINKEWHQHAEFSPKGTFEMQQDADAIQLHLNLVIQHLRKHADVNLHPTQLSNRLYLLDQLQRYANRKVFPINRYHALRQPYFVDELGTHCAVGQMIHESGRDDLVREIVNNHNFDYIENIRHPELLNWAHTHGFTLDELKWIQPAYMPGTRIQQVGDATNGEVVKIAHSSSVGLVIAGEFSQLDNLPCLNIGVYQNDQLSCLGQGLNGTIKDVFIENGEVYASGELPLNGTTYPLARFNGTSWIHIPIPGRPNAVGAATLANSSLFMYQIAISHPTLPNQQEIWVLNNNLTWKLKCKVNGFVEDMNQSFLGVTFAGHFDTVTVYDANNNISELLPVRNVVINSFSDDWYGIGDYISDTVYTIVDLGNSLLFGGSCTNVNAGDTVCISRYTDSVLQPLYVNWYAGHPFIIKDMVYKNGQSSLIVGGFFYNSINLFGDQWRNIAKFDLVQNQFHSVAVLNRQVNSLAIINDQLFLGGDFTQQNHSGGQEALKHLGMVEYSSLALEEVQKDQNHPMIHPNPFTTTLTLDDIMDGAKYSIRSLEGRVSKTGTVSNQSIVDLEDLPSGVYLLQLEGPNGWVSKKLIKQ